MPRKGGKPKRSAKRRLSIYRPEYDVLVSLLKEIREDAGLSQQELARRLKVQQTFVSKTEVKDRRVDLVEIADICAACGISLREFVRRYVERTHGM